MARRLWWISGAMLLVLALALGIWWFWGRNPGPQQVKAGVVAPISLQEEVYGTGSVVPVSRQEVRVLTPGRVAKVAVKVGDKVQAGQTLVELDTALLDAQVAQAGIGVEAAQTGVNIAQANLNELKKAQSLKETMDESSLLPSFLGEQNSAPQENLVSPVVVKQAEGALEQSKAALKQAQELLKVARVQREQLSYKAGIAGTVLEVNAEAGNLASVQLPLVVVADLSQMNVEAKLNEVDAGKVRVGGKASITSKLLGDSSVQGTIREIAPAAVSELTVQGNSSPTVGVVIGLDKVPAELKPGFTVSIEMIVATKAGVLAVPQEALFQEGNNTYVYRIQGGKLAKTAVKIGIGNDSHQEITSGLKSGDQVAVNPSREFYEGMPVLAGTGSEGQ